MYRKRRRDPILILLVICLIWWLRTREETTLSRIADRAADRTTKTYVILDSPHFDGGRALITRYLDSRGWKQERSDPVLVLASCHQPWPATSRARIVSMAPDEKRIVSKIALFQAVRAFFAERDYRDFYPESFLAQTEEDCEAVRRVMARDEEGGDVWFLKYARDSFGDGIVVRTASEALLNEFATCQTSRPPVLVQRGVRNIMQYEGRNAQGRAYLLIPSYAPASAWFFMGYFNVAGGRTDREAHISNLRSNQDSRRFLLHEFMQGQDIALAATNIKRAVLTTYLALRPGLGQSPSSFSLIGVDFIVQTNLHVKVLETNCNCELFSLPERYGKERVLVSSTLVPGMMDIVLAAHLDPTAYADHMADHPGNGWELLHN